MAEVIKYAGTRITITEMKAKLYKGKGQLFPFTILKIIQDCVPSCVLVAVENLQNLPSFIREDLLQANVLSFCGANSRKLNT